jgi:hypothetical protein
MTECGLHYSDSGTVLVTDTFENDKERCVSHKVKEIS